MTTHEPTEPETGFDRGVLLAVVSPMLAGFAWATLMYFWWKNEADQPYADLTTAFAFWGLVVLGCAGFIGLSVPLVIGLTARSRGARIAAASAGAAISALAGAFWLLGGVAADPTGTQAVLGYAAAAVLFLPLIALAAAARPAVSGRRLPGPASR